jgi:transmembrane sensor
MSRGTGGGSDNPREALDSIEREAHDWVVRFASGEATSADLREGKLWCERSPAHAAAFARASRLWDGLGPQVFTESHRQLRSFASRPVARRAMLGGAMAASAAGAAYLLVRPPLGLWPSWSELTADYRTATGEQRRITLANRAAIDMNTQTSIAVQRAASGGDRIELISGEAVIATAPDAATSFVVIAGEGRARATNAKFNVRNEGTSVCVTCLEGDVQVERRAAAVLLRARQQVTYDGAGLGAIASIDPAAVTAWQEGLLVFHATPLRDVVAEVNRYRPGKIILMNDGLGRRLFSANFHIRNADAVIVEAQRLFGAKARSLPGGIVLLS